MPIFQGISLYDSGGTGIAVGQTTMSASVPVVIASNQSVFPVNIEASSTALTATGSSLNVNITGGSSSGGITDEGTYTEGTTTFQPIGGYYKTSITSLSTGQGGAVAMTAGRAMYADIHSVGGTSLGAPSNYGTSPGAVEVMGVNSYVTNIVEVSPTTSANTLSNQFFVQITDGTHGVTTNSTTYTSKYGLDINILGTLGIPFSTAGKVDVKGADGDVFVRQTTGSNLHTVVDSGTITTVSTVTTVTNPVKIEGNAGGILDAATGAAVPANAIQVGGSDGTDLRALRTSTAGTQIVVSADEVTAHPTMGYFSVDTLITPVSVASGTPACLVAFQTESSSVVATIRTATIATNGALAYWALVYKPTLSGGTFAVTGGSGGGQSTSKVNAGITSYALGTGTVIASGYVFGDGVTIPLDLMANQGTPGGQYALIANPVSGTVGCYGALTWTETATAL